MVDATKTVKVPKDEAEREALLTELLSEDDLEALKDLRSKRAERAMRQEIKDRTDLILGLVEDTDGDPTIAPRYEKASTEIDKIEAEAREKAEAAIKTEHAEVDAA